jgi:hypothetical protein
LIPSGRTLEAGARVARLGVLFAVLVGTVTLSHLHPPLAMGARQATPRPIDYQDLNSPPVTTSWHLPDYPLIEAMHESIIGTFVACETQFEGEEGLVYGLMPAHEYGMIYVRDLSTMMPALTSFYGDQHLRTPIEELLRRQYGPKSMSADADVPGDGAVSAIVAADGHIDKATTVSDEEVHLINAAYHYYSMVGGTDWLRKEVGRETVLSHLNRAMEWLYANRYCPTMGLIKRGHTTDWGDVKFEPSAFPTDLDTDADHWTCSIYDQALTYRALLQLAEMNGGIGADLVAEDLRDRAERIRLSTDRELWNEEHEVYRIHVHITPFSHPFPEDEMVSISNALVAYVGLSDPSRSSKVLASLERARLSAGASKPGLSIYPPYPPGFFSHPQMSAGRYQNGGLWDWWGAVQITAEFENGKSSTALAHLRMVAREWAMHPGQIFEWQVPADDQGWGSHNYGSAAATMAEAILTGLYGVTIESDGISLCPRLGKHDGQVRVVQPATGLYLSYDYEHLAGAIILDYGSNHPNALEMAVLLPRGREIERVSVDGHEVPYRMETLLEDCYCTFKGDSGVHRAVLAFKNQPELGVYRTAHGSSSHSPPP